MPFLCILERGSQQFGVPPSSGGVDVDVRREFVVFITYTCVLGLT